MVCIKLKGGPSFLLMLVTRVRSAARYARHTNWTAQLTMAMTWLHAACTLCPRVLGVQPIVAVVKSGRGCMAVS